MTEEVRILLIAGLIGMLTAVISAIAIQLMILAYERRRTSHAVPVQAVPEPLPAAEPQREGAISEPAPEAAAHLRTEAIAAERARAVRVITAEREKLREQVRRWQEMAVKAREKSRAEDGDSKTADYWRGLSDGLDTAAEELRDLLGRDAPPL